MRYCIIHDTILAVEWCKTAEFKPVVGDFVMTDLRSLEYIIPDLDKVSRSRMHAFKS